MPNTYFQFKQFRVEQGQSAMKVTTDACILGAWVARHSAADQVLDIGAGTGLLSLMVAQRIENAKVTAVEMNDAAAEQAQANFEASRWTDRLTVENCKVQDLELEQRFDLIVSNPPFFNQSLASPTASINQARHDSTLSQSDLLEVLVHRLADQGKAYVLYPPREAAAFKELAIEKELFSQSELTVFNSPGSMPFRSIISFGLQRVEPQKSVLVIKDPAGQYTADFVELLKDYYLHL
ncbi:tRNA1(Val) (adenine(37)-N6)-methyltransferase [Marinoscillum sp.]|uniref:tRNA1(Val) (adenine(37)-N6)-methyltransferase n=1 Tax=Marinoscillum sp. TaxID=2024838 RepID=UPI003BA93B44